MTKQVLSEHDRLRLILEAVLYCKNVKKLGMPVSCYSKALREPIHFLWERYLVPKRQAAKYISKKAAQIQNVSGKTIYDHSIPFIYLQNKLLSLNQLNTDNIKKLLDKYTLTTIITKDENTILNKELKSKMPNNWDGKNPLARYDSVGIDVVKNVTK
jgi:hypothetical protein